MNKLIIGVGIVLVGVSFYGGMKFATGKGSGSMQQANASGSFRRGMGTGAGNPMGMRTGGGFTMGDIIAKDDKSITLKLRDGGSKIIFYSSTTEVGKFTSGTASDLLSGKSVSVTGTTNADGSITAQSIQVRPPQPSASPTSTN